MLYCVGVPLRTSPLFPVDLHANCENFPGVIRMPWPRPKRRFGCIRRRPQGALVEVLPEERRLLELEQRDEPITPLTSLPCIQRWNEDAPEAS